MRGDSRRISRLTLCCTTYRAVRPVTLYQRDPHVVDILHQDTPLPQARLFQDVLQNLPSGQIWWYAKGWFCCRPWLIQVLAEAIMHLRMWLKISTSQSPFTTRNYHHLLNNSPWLRLSLARAPLLACYLAGDKVFLGMLEDEVDVMFIFPLAEGRFFALTTALQIYCWYVIRKQHYFMWP